MKKTSISVALIFAVNMIQTVVPALAGNTYEPIGAPRIPAFEKIIADGGALIGRTGTKECRFEVRKILWSGRPTYMWSISYEYDAEHHWRKSVSGGFDFASQLKEKNGRKIRLRGMAGHPGRHTSLYIDTAYSGSNAGQITKIRAVGYGISELLFPVETIVAEFDSPRETNFSKLYENSR